jgi:hypothetical protein
MVGQYEELSCPFCDEGRIRCLFIPASVRVKQSRSRVIRGNQKVKNAEVWMIQSGCNVCGKNQKDVEKKLKENGII